MKALIAAILMAVLCGCTSKTEFGFCIGIADDKSPNLEYKLSVWNTVIALIFSETIIVPVFVLVDQTFCPVGKK